MKALSHRRQLVEVLSGVQMGAAAGKDKGRTGEGVRKGKWVRSAQGLHVLQITYGAHFLTEPRVLPGNRGANRLHPFRAVALLAATHTQSVREMGVANGPRGGGESRWPRTCTGRRTTWTATPR